MKDPVYRINSVTNYDVPVNADYWGGEHPRPLAPDLADVDVYRSFIDGSESVLLLGNTRLLMPLCTAAMDTDPFLDDPRVITQDWTTNTVRYDAIIGDGVLNFTQDLAERVLAMAAASCSVFVARVFTERLPIMRVADNFPVPNDFDPAPTEVRGRNQYSFYVWRF